MVSTTQGCNGNITVTTNKYETNKKLSERKSLYQLLEALDVKHKTTVCGLGTNNAKQTAIITATDL